MRRNTEKGMGGGTCKKHCFITTKNLENGNFGIKVECLKDGHS
jgi:hypothetical protein